MELRIEKILKRQQLNFMELNNNEGLRSLNWPSLEEYTRLKTKFKESRKEEAVDILNRGRGIRKISDSKKAIATDLILDFMFGLQMTANLFGYDEKVPDLKIRPMKGYLVVTRKEGEGVSFIFNSIDIRKAVKDAENGHSFDLGGTYLDEATPQQVFELSGVEEMAHTLFIKTKGFPERSLSVAAGSKYIDYESQDIEERALYWKTSYSKRYMPEVYENHTSHLRSVIENRNHSKEAEYDDDDFYDVSRGRPGDKEDVYENW